MNYWPGTQIPKSTHNGFVLGLRQSDADWSDIFTFSKLRQGSTESNERRRAEGRDNSTFYGMSRKADAGIKPLPRRVRHKPQGESKAARIREFLKDGPKDSLELGKLLGIPAKHARAILQYDCEQGNVVKLHDSRPTKYALAGAV